MTAIFTVEFGKIGRTLEYRDAAGCIVFTFEAAGPKSLILEHHGARHTRPSNYDQAFARSKEFLASRGYGVEEFGVASQPPALTEEEAAAVIHGMMLHEPPQSIALITPPCRANFADDAGGSRWSLWVVAELAAGPHRGHKVVFDEVTKQFGVASPSDVFLGFWGSFKQTLEALIPK
jgi:hypothetical protein